MPAVTTLQSSTLLRKICFICLSMSARRWLATAVSFAITLGMLPILHGEFHTGYGQPIEGPPPTAKSFVILAVNDVYRIEGVDERTQGGLARLRRLRAELEQVHPDLLLLHAGDLLFPSFLSQLYNGQQMIDVLNLLDGDSDAFDPRMLVTFGNHEFDRATLGDTAMLASRIQESQFRWIGSNIEFTSGADGRLLVEAPNLVDNALVESGGVKVGVFSLTTPIGGPTTSPMSVHLRPWPVE